LKSQEHYDLPIWVSKKLPEEPKKSWIEKIKQVFRFGKNA